MMMAVRALSDRRLRMDGFGSGARNAMEKSCVETGDDGVTMMAGRGDFSVRDGRERSKGAGIKV